MEFIPAIKCLYSKSTQKIIRAINSAIDLEDYKEILEKGKERSSFEYALKKGRSFHYSCLIHTGFTFFTHKETEYELFYDFAYEFLVSQKGVAKNIKKLGLHYCLIGNEISSTSKMIAKTIDFKESKWKLVELKDKNSVVSPIEITGKNETYIQEGLTKSLDERLFFIHEGDTVSLEEDEYVDTYDENDDSSHIDFSNKWIDWYCKRFD